MYKLLAAAIVSVVMIIFVFLFAPGTKRINKPKQQPSEIKKQERVVHKEENVTDLMSVKTSDDEKITFKKMDIPRGDAASHGMEEKYFVPFNVNDYETMNRNLQERLTSISNARVKSERAKKNYEAE